MRKEVVLVAMMALPMICGAENLEIKKEKFEAGVSCDFLSGYVWRGQDLGGVSIQPDAYLQYQNVKLDVWGSVGFESTDTKEVDITLGYTYKGLNISVTDYFFNNGPGFFQYKAHKTNHTFEAHVGYDLGCVALDWYTIFAGLDGVNKDGKRAYSSYFQISAPFKFVGIDWSAELGIVPYATTLYNASTQLGTDGTNGLAVCNVGLGACKEIKVTESFSVPLYAKFIVNPRTEGVYFVAGFSL